MKLSLYSLSRMDCPKAPGPKAVYFSPEVYEFLVEVLHTFRDQEGDESIKMNRCLELIAADYFSGHQ